MLQVASVVALVAESSSSSSSASASSATPGSAWDTVPYFIHCGNNSGGVSEPLLALMAGAGFTVVQVQQGMNSDGFVCSNEHDPAKCNSTGAEGKMADLAARVRAVNPRARSVFYYTVDNIRVESDLGRYFLAHPELTLTRYSVDRHTGQLGEFQMFQYDFSNPATVAAWAAGIAAAVKTGGHDGVFIDGYQGWHDCKPAPPGTGGAAAAAGAVDVDSSTGHLSGCPSEASKGLRTTVGNRTVNTTALLQGWWYETGPALAKALPAGSILIPNCEAGYGCQDGNGSSRIPGYTGVMEEFFGELGTLPNETDTQNGKTPDDDEGIASLPKLAEKGTLAEINWTDEKDKDSAVLALAAFLSGAGRNQYFGVIGWHWNCAEIPVETLTPLYKKPLGAPLAPATVTVEASSVAAGASNVTYQRKFAKGTSVMLSAIHNGGRNAPPARCCILWGDGTNSTCSVGDCTGVGALSASPLYTSADETSPPLKAEDSIVRWAL